MCEINCSGGCIECSPEDHVKKLFVLIRYSGDGSYHTRYTFNEEWVKEQERLYEDEDASFDFEADCDGDGFHYDTLTVPDGVTLESLGIRYDCAERK